MPVEACSDTGSASCLYGPGAVGAGIRARRAGANRGEGVCRVAGAEA